MHLIWYNTTTTQYEYGSKTSFRALKTASTDPSSLSILMEFTSDKEHLAYKVIEELNVAKTEFVIRK